MAKPEDQLNKWFDTLKDRVKRNLVNVLEEEAEKLKEAMLESLQGLEEDPEDTGNLEASLEVVDGKDETEKVIIAGGAKTTGADGYDHANAFEYGTQKQPARSFFWSTYRAKKAEIRERINQAVENEIKNS